MLNSVVDTSKKCYNGGENMKNNEKEKRKPLTELTLLDRFLFDTAMNDPEFCHNVLSIIFDDDELPPVPILY